MQLSIALVAAIGAVSTIAAPTFNLKPRQQNACFVTGDVTLPDSTASDVAELEAFATCNADSPTLQGIPDVTIGGVTFSEISFANSDESPLQFALREFATTEPLAENDLDLFVSRLAVYIATEAGLRSTGGNFGPIKIPKFFLEFQVSRIRVAQGNAPAEAGLQVDHLLGKVTSNGAGEDQALLDQVTALASQLQ